jgi:hypothetical protein
MSSKPNQENDDAKLDPTKPVMVLSPDADDDHHDTQCSLSSVNSNATMVMSSKPNKEYDDAKLDKAMARCAYPLLRTLWKIRLPPFVSIYFEICSMDF